MITAVIAAAGKGSRMGEPINKLLLPLCGRPIICHTLDAFEKSVNIDHILVVVSEDDQDVMRELVVSNGYTKIRDVVIGGSERQQSIANALKKLPQGTRWVAIHDGARPLIQQGTIKEAVEQTYMYKAVGVAVPVKDTIKVADEEQFVAATPERKRLWAMQTPQVFCSELLLKAYQNAEQRNIIATDDAALVETIGYKVKLVQGEYTNLKITTPEDLIFAETMLRRDGRCE